MTDHPLFKRPDFLSVSQLVEFNRCPRRFFYKTGCGLVPPEEKTAAYFGTCIHRAVGTWFETFDETKCREAFFASWGSTVGDDHRNPIVAERIISEFAKLHKPLPGGVSLSGPYTPLIPPVTPVKIKADDSVSKFEFPFAVDIGLGVPFVGRIDGLCRHNFRNDLWINEFKTSFEVSDRLFRAFKRNPQIIGYVVASTIQLDKPVKGAMVEILPTQKTKVIPQIIPIEPSSDDIEAFLIWARNTGYQIMQCCDTGEFPKNVSSCTSYPQHYQAGYICDYDPLCTVPDWRQLLSTYNHERHIPYILE